MISRSARFILVTAIVFVAYACSPSGTVVEEGDVTPPPAESDVLVITSPEDATTVSERVVVVTGVAPDGADVVREVSLGRDEHTTASGGRWSMSVGLDPGDNLLTFRLGDDATTSTTLLLILDGATATDGSPPEQPGATTAPDETPRPDATTGTVDGELDVQVTKRSASVARNRTASVTIKTTKGASCEITVEYNSGPSTAAGLGAKKASNSGTVTWKWKVGGRTAKGEYPIFITCTKGDREGSATTSFRVR